MGATILLEVMNGFAAVSSAKQRIRERMWGVLDKTGLAPGCYGRIPNLQGTFEAARQLTSLQLWATARVVMISPDDSAAAVRWEALRAGKLVYMAVPRIERQMPFVLLDPSKLPNLTEADAETDRALEWGRPVGLKEMRRINLVVGGSVAVNREGARIGKGMGYFDTELALLVEANLVPPHTPVATTVHSRQVIEGHLPEAPHDGRVSIFATEKGTFIVPSAARRPLPGIVAEMLDERESVIPALRELLREVKQGI